MSEAKTDTDLKRQRDAATGKEPRNARGRRRMPEKKLADVEQQFDNATTEHEGTNQYRLKTTDGDDPGVSGIPTGGEENADVNQ